MIWLLLSDLILSGSVVTLQPTTEPGAIAEVIFDNRNVNDADDNGTYALSMDGLSIAVDFLWNADGSADRITVTPPDGVLCRPSSCALTLPEDQSGRLVLFEFEGM